MRNWTKAMLGAGILAAGVGVWVMWRLCNTNTGLEEFGELALQKRWKQDQAIRESAKFGQPFIDKAHHQVFVSQPSSRGFILTFYGIDALYLSFDQDDRVSGYRFEFQSLGL